MWLLQPYVVCLAGFLGLVVMTFLQCDWTLCFLVGIEILSWYEPFPWAYLLGVGLWCSLCDNKASLDLHMAGYPWFYLLQGPFASGMTFYKGLVQRALGMKITCWLGRILSIKWNLFMISLGGLECKHDWIHNPFLGGGLKWLPGHLLIVDWEQMVWNLRKYCHGIAILSICYEWLFVMK